MNKKLLRGAAVLLLCIASAWPAQANSAVGLDADELKIYSPNDIVRGERELEYVSFVSGPGQQQGYALSAGYGLTSWWAAELYEVLHRDPQGPLLGDHVEVENRFRLTPPGLYWVDLGFLVEAEVPEHAEDHGEVHAAPLFEKQVSSWLATLNLPLEWQYGPGFTSGTDFGYKARVEYLLNPLFSPGVEYFGDSGVIGDFPAAGQQNHMLGPAIYGSWHLGGRQNLKYRVVPLWGLTAGSPNWAVVTQLELEL